MENQTVMTCNENQKQVELDIQGIYLYQGFQVLETFTINKDECYYLLFYKNQFLTGKMTNKMKRKSTLKQIVSKGIYLPSPHSIIQLLLSQNSIQNFPTFNMTWKSINQNFDKVEAAHILTIFDSYIKKDKILSVLNHMVVQSKEAYNFLQSVRIQKIMVENYSNQIWDKSVMTREDYQQYSLPYQSELEMDPLHTENQLYLQMKSVEAFNLLQKKLREESRSLESVALYCHRLSSNPEDFKRNYNDLYTTLTTHFSKIETRSILESVYQQSIPLKNKEWIHQHLLTQLIATEEYEEAFAFMVKVKIPLPANQIHQVLLTLKNVNFINLEEFTADIFMHADSQQLEQIVNVLTPKLLEQFDINNIYHWLTPILHQPLPFINTIKAMYEIKEEPDQQHILGELYYQLHQLPKALDCFLWDEELNPTNPRPIGWLTKLYHELGMEEESKSYQYLYKQIHKSS